MNLIEHQKNASRTYPDLGSKLNNSIHLTSGMCTEIGELVKCMKMLPKPIDFVNASEEIGDLFWYLVNYATLYDLDLSALNNMKPNTTYLTNIYQKATHLDPLDLLVVYSSELLDLDKKELAYNKPKDMKVLETTFINLVKATFDFHTTRKIMLPTLEKILDTNIYKLKKRYPEKFDVEKAINRDLDAERKILEQ